MSAPDRPVFEPVDESTVCLAELETLRVLANKRTGTTRGVRFEIFHSRVAAEYVTRSGVQYLVGQLLAWLWQAHTPETVQLAHEVVAQLLAWRNGQMDGEQAAQLLQALGIVRTINRADVPGREQTP